MTYGFNMYSTSIAAYQMQIETLTINIESPDIRIYFILFFIKNKFKRMCHKQFYHVVNHTTNQIKTS